MAINVFVLSIVPVIALGDDSLLTLEKGVGVTRENFSQLAETSMPLSVARSGQRSRGANWVSGFYLLEDESTVYSISDKAVLFATEYPSRNLISNWVLTRWESEYIEQELLDTYQYGMEWSEILSEPNDLMGCMLRAPLRYGDIAGDGEGDLVILLPSEYSVDWSIFSTALNKIIFSSKLNYTNSIPESEAPDYLTPDLQGNEYQYWLRSGVESDRPGQMGPALRAYGKLYLGDFNEDGALDIILWRKLYQSRAKGDQVLGFKLVRQNFLHYQLKDGAFQQIDTDESLIGGWMQQANLTWQKGYPKNSECPENEGKLIQEMHDPLLNDPDVLQ